MKYIFLLLFQMDGAPIRFRLWVAGMAPRAVGEERMLHRELSGYDEYARRVRFRLIPGIW